MIVKIIKMIKNQSCICLVDDGLNFPEVLLDEG
jgi:hypothetical protein